MASLHAKKCEASDTLNIDMILVSTTFAQRQQKPFRAVSVLRANDPKR
jgi:hypothetical protein